MKVSLKQLEILHAVAVAGSISRAMRRLEMSQPNISQQLAKMEEALGTQLLLRGRSLRTELTPAG
ncbi:MAG: LysR family transcriptional regulator, partial [Alphaproteobacteria bacterium]|nr:LysR family transcriptional regulator [Alphaproteobacteria bacterium]